MKNYLIQFITGIIFYKKAFVFLMNNKLLYFLIFPIIINIFLSYIGFYFTDMISNYLHDQMLLLINSKLDSVILEGGVLSTLISISLWIISKIFFIFLFLTCSGYLTILILSPVFSFLSEKIAAIHNGYSNTFTLRQFLNDILRAGVIAFRNILIQLSLNILFFLIGFFPVVGWVVSIFGNIIVTSYFYGFSFMDFSNERNRLSVKESVIFIRKKSGLAIGIGFVFYSCLLIPFVGSFLASLLSVFSLTAATLSFEEMNINSTAFQSTESLH
jgi:CysZ protein